MSKQDRIYIKLQTILDGRCGGYKYRYDYCLLIDSMARALSSISTMQQHTIASTVSIIRFPIGNNSNLSKFAGFDKDSLVRLFGLFNMNEYLLISNGEHVPVLNGSASFSIRQIRTSSFYFA